MRIEEHVIEREYLYIAEDGKAFQNERTCNVYEKYHGQSIYDVVKDYIKCFDEETIKELKNNVVKHFSYILLTKEIPDEILTYIKIIEKGYCGMPHKDFKYKLPCLFYNNWTSAYSGGYGFNGWEAIGDETSIKDEIEKYEKILEYFK